jgi:hypothetical protein
MIKIALNKDLDKEIYLDFVDLKIEGAAVSKTLIRQLESEYDIEQIKPGQIVSIHWSVPCEVITEKQASTLRKYTLQNIAFANLTV